MTGHILSTMNHKYEYVNVFKDRRAGLLFTLALFLIVCYAYSIEQYKEPDTLWLTFTNLSINHTRLEDKKINTDGMLKNVTNDKLIDRKQSNTSDANKCIINPNMTSQELWKTDIDFNRFNNNLGLIDGRDLVPSIVHFIRLGHSMKNMSFIHMVCILSVLKHQKPDKIYIYTDVNKFAGKHWKWLMANQEFKNVICVRKVHLRDTVYGQKFNPQYKIKHNSDVLRLKVLKNIGGIYLDNDIYLVRSLDYFRRFEFSVGFGDRNKIGNQVLICHRSARFLQLYLESYRGHYTGQCYYNAGVRPVAEILDKRPELIHKVDWLFGVHAMAMEIFDMMWMDWRSMYTVNTLMDHQYLLTHSSQYTIHPVEFNEENIKNYPITLRDMVNEVYPLNLTGSKEVSAEKRRYRTPEFLFLYR